MVQEYVDDQAVAVSVKTTKLTGHVLAKMIAATLRQMEKNKVKLKSGRQSMRRLVRDGKDTDSIEVMGRIKSFERIARKYKIAYHAEKDSSVNPPKYTVFFKSSQKGALTAAFKEYASLMLGKGNKRKPSILKQLRQIKEHLKNQVIDRVKHKDRKGIEL